MGVNVNKTIKSVKLLSDLRPSDLREPGSGYKISLQRDGSYHHTRYRGPANIRHSWDEFRGVDFNHHATDQDLSKSWSWDEL